MAARIFSKTGALAGTEHIITADTIIGRHQHCDLVLFPHSISGQHAKISVDGKTGAYYLEDLGSSNGTQLDRTDVNERVRLGALNVITLSEEFDLIFQASVSKHVASRPQTVAPAAQAEHTVLGEQFSPPPAFEPDHTDAAPNKTVIGASFDAIPDLNTPKAKPVVPPKPKAFSLEVKENSGNRTTFSLHKGRNTVGRSSTCDITIVDPFMSGMHAEIMVQDDGIFIKDLGSSNHTYVNDEKIAAPAALKPDFQVRFGPNIRARLVG